MDNVLRHVIKPHGKCGVYVETRFPTSSLIACQMQNQYILWVIKEKCVVKSEGRAFYYPFVVTFLRLLLVTRMLDWLIEFRWHPFMEVECGCRSWFKLKFKTPWCEAVTEKDRWSVRGCQVSDKKERYGLSKVQIQGSSSPVVEWPSRSHLPIFWYRLKIDLFKKCLTSPSPH